MGLFGPPDVEKMKAKGDIKGLIKILVHHKDAETRQAAAEALGKLGKPALDLLFASLRDRDFDVRWKAAAAFKEIGLPIVSLLITALKDENTHLRWHAANLLGEIGTQMEDGGLRARAVDGLISTLDDKDVNVADEAARALGKIGAPAMEPLVAAFKLGSRSRSFVVFGFRALKEIGWRPGNDEMSATYWIGESNWEECAKIGAPAVGPIIAALMKMKDWKLEGTLYKPAVKALGKIGAPAVEPLIAALKLGGEDMKIMRSAAADALGWIGFPAVEALISLLKDNDNDLRFRVVRILGKIRDSRSMESLIATLKDSSGKIRLEAAECLRDIGWHPDLDRAGAEYWLAMAGNPARASEKNEKELMEYCEKIGLPAIEPLIIAINRQDNYVSRMAVKVLIAFYRSEQLDEAAKKLILAHRSEISVPHYDHHGDSDGSQEHYDTITNEPAMELLL